MRPDRCGIVFETMPETVKMNGRDMPVIEAYVIPGRDEEAFNNNSSIRSAIIEICRSGYAVLWRMRGGTSPGPERVRLIALISGAMAVGPVVDTIEPSAESGGFRKYSSTDERIVRSSLALALAAAETKGRRK